MVAVGLLVGSLPSVVKKVAATPDPPLLSAAGSGVLTDALYHPVEHAAPLQEIIVVGAAASIWICCDFTGSAFPAVSTEKNFTVDVPGTVNAPVYTVLDVVGVEPSVV